MLATCNGVEILANLNTDEKPQFLGKRIKWSVFLLVLLVGLGFGYEVCRVLLGSNFHILVPGKVYRCAQPTRESLRHYANQYGIKTIINLRGCAPCMPWYEEEAQASYDLDLNQEDINLSAGRLPSVTEIKRLMDVLDQAEYPVLVHCRRGSDRTGLVSAIIKLLQEDVSYDEGRGYLSYRYGHIAIGRTAHMASFFEIYEEWLAKNSFGHSPQRFRHWVLNEYRSGHCLCRIEECIFPKEPIRANQSFSIQVKLKNIGSRPWEFKPTKKAGVHLNYVLLNSKGKMVGFGRGGMFDRRVEPGENINITLPINPIYYPGKYWLYLDMIEEQLGQFFQMGSEPLEMRLEVRE